VIRVTPMSTHSQYSTANGFKRFTQYLTAEACSCSADMSIRRSVVEHKEVRLFGIRVPRRNSPSRAHAAAAFVHHSRKHRRIVAHIRDESLATPCTHIAVFQHMSSLCLSRACLGK
jgi:hypothetical protein